MIFLPKRNLRCVENSFTSKTSLINFRSWRLSQKWLRHQQRTSSMTCQHYDQLQLLTVMNWRSFWALIVSSMSKTVCSGGMSGNTFTLVFLGWQWIICPFQVTSLYLLLNTTSRVTNNLFQQHLSMSNERSARDGCCSPTYVVDYLFSPRVHSCVLGYGVCWDMYMITMWKPQLFYLQWMERRKNWQKIGTL